MPHYPLSNPLSSPLCFQYESLDNITEITRHTHAWGQLNIIDHGVMEIMVNEQTLIAPCDYGIWIPAHIEHASLYKQAHQYCSIYIESRPSQLPKTPCILAIEPLLKAILHYFFSQQVTVLEDDAQKRLAEVLIDRLAQAPGMQHYLPTTQDKYLGPILTQLRENPGDNRTLCQWAQTAYTTERTLARRCQKELGLSFGEWRQRLRFITALRLLKQSRSIQEIAFDLGYSSSSAFIAMFRRHAGTSPEQYAKQ